MSNAVASQQLRAFVERIERLQEERKTIADDIAEVFKEATDTGFDKVALKAVLKIRSVEDGIAKWHENSAILDLYLGALGMITADERRAPAHARVEKIEQFPASGKVEASVVVTAVSPSPPAASGADEMAAPFEPPAFLTRADKPLRPHCLRPDNCGGYGKIHCHSCLAASDQVEVA